MIILKNLGVDRLSCAYFVRSEPPQGSRIFLEPGIVASGRRRGRWVRPCAQLAGSGPVPSSLGQAFVPSPLGVRGGALCPIAPRDRGLWAAPRSPGQASCRTP
jgi:hypothetical protein